MAKRKRLDVPLETIPADLETKSAFSAPRARMPIADVAGEVAGRAALEEVAREMTAAEDEGRVVKKLPLDKIELRHLARDRMVLDEEEMTALMAVMARTNENTNPEKIAGRIRGSTILLNVRRLLAPNVMEASSRARSICCKAAIAERMPTGMLRKIKQIIRMAAEPVKINGAVLNDMTYPIPTTVPGIAKLSIEVNSNGALPKN